MHKSLLFGEVSEIWHHFFKFNFFNVIFFIETSLGYLGTSPGRWFLFAPFLQEDTVPARGNSPFPLGNLLPICTQT